MLSINMLVIFYFLFVNCFIVLSKTKATYQKRFYLILNIFIIVWELIPFFVSNKESLQIVFDWSPLFLLPIAHRQTALLTTGRGSHARDKAFIKFENRYFSSIMDLHHRNGLCYTLLSEYLHFCYLTFYLLIYGVPLYFYLKHQLPEFYVSTFAILCLLFSCFITHGFIPVDGPRNIFAKITDHRSRGVFFRLVHVILAKGSTPGTAFPSGHTGLASIVLFISHILYPPLFWVIMPFATGLIFSTIYGRFHYVSDLIVGLMYALAVFTITLLVYDL